MPGRPRRGGDVLHVIWSFAADVEGDGHAEFFEELASGVGEDGEGTGCEFLVLWDEVGFAAADDDDGGGDAEGEVILHRDALG